MKTTSNFHPNWTTSPGSTILDILREMHLPFSMFAKKMDCDEEYIEELVSGKISISIDLANKLERVLGVSTNFWVQRDRIFKEDTERIEKEWIENLPIKDMVKYGWIDKSTDYYSACLKYFGVNDLKSWRKRYGSFIHSAAFRTSASFKSDLGSVATWIRQGEIIGSSIKCKVWNDELFEETLVNTIKPLTRKKNPKDFLPILVEACAECGVAVAIVQTPSGCKASGATMFLSKKRALLLLSFRYLSDDQFWFTFFHEAGHLTLHGPNLGFIEEIDGDRKETQEENEANMFAGEILIQHELQSELKRLRGKRDIINFAMKAGVSPGIVVGQMQYRGFTEHKFLNGYKRRYKWDDIYSIIPKLLAK